MLSVGLSLSLQIRDGAALCEYLYWLEERMKEEATITEISGADKLQTLRM